MALAYKCDRCGTLYAHDEKTQPKFGIVICDERDIIRNRPACLDLCPGCQEDLENFVNFPTREKYELDIEFKPEVSE